MYDKAPPLTGIARTFGDHQLIVSKTDHRGIITYANDLFLELASMTRGEAIGAPHNCVRHPQMPRAVFKLLWDTVGAGQELFAYVVNRSKNGDHYWVYAHVTPSLDSGGRVIGFHSNRRNPRRAALDVIIPIYKLLTDEEQKHSSAKEGLEASTRLLHKFLADKGTDYERFIHSV